MGGMLALEDSVPLVYDGCACQEQKAAEDGGCEASDLLDVVVDALAGGGATYVCEHKSGGV